MVSTKQEVKKEARKAEKQDRKRDNIAKVETSKREKTMWEKLGDDRKGISQTDSKEDASKDGPKTPKRSLRVRKVKPENRLAHRRTRGQYKSYVHVRTVNGGTLRVSRKEAVKIVAAGGQYLSKTKFRKAQEKAHATAK
jgi:hypothetical protein